jgi:hypothetical protein
MIRALAGLYFCLLLGGCVSQLTVPIEPAATRAFPGLTAATTRRTPPDFSAGAPGQFLLGAFGIVPTLTGEAAMEHFGNVLAAENGLEDPAVYIGSTLMAELAQKHGLIPVETGESLVADESPKKLSMQFAASRILIDIRTIDWGLMNHPVKWNHYGVMYVAKFRIIDTASAKVIAESYCEKPAFTSRPDLTREELLADRAQRLKDELRAAADFCIEEFRTEALAEHRV